MTTRILLLVSIVALLTACSAKQELPDISFDGLERLSTKQVNTAYIDPNADFGVYRRIAILEPAVSFRANWQRDQNRSRTQRINDADMERIKKDVASLLEASFRQALEAGNGYEIVNTAGPDVLVLRPAIVNLDVSAPDKSTAGRSLTFAASAGSATLYLELFDSTSGAIIGRAIDRRGNRRGADNFYWANSVSNSAEAKRIMLRWGKILRGFLDDAYLQHLDLQEVAEEL